MEEAIRKRRSVRTYQNKPLTEEQKALVRETVEAFQGERGPFGHSAKLFSFFLDRQEGKKEKVGTYGFVKNASAYFGGTTQNTFRHLVDFGYVFERLILALTAKGFGTVWLGGTFHRKQFQRFARRGHIIPAVSPVGIPAEKTTLREKAIRKFSKASNRVPLSEIAFQDEFSEPLSSDHPLADVLEYVRIGPSASNKQPWRMLVRENKVHFYLHYHPGYKEKAFGYNLQALDGGIALAHFAIAMTHKGFGYRFVYDQKAPQSSMYEYVLSADTKR